MRQAASLSLFDSDTETDTLTVTTFSVSQSLTDSAIEIDNVIWQAASLTLADALTATDTLNTIGASAYVASLTDATAASDALTSALFAISGSLTDSATGIDSLTAAAITYALALTDITLSIDGFYNSAASLSDSDTTSDQFYIPEWQYVATLADAANDNDIFACLAIDRTRRLPTAAHIGDTALLIRLLQAAINNLTLPPGIPPAQVMTRMPANGWTAMPFVVVNLELIQQSDTEIGEDFANPGNDNVWTLFANARRIWRVTVQSQSAEERDYYRDTLLAIFRILYVSPYSYIGLNVEHSFQAVSYTSVEEWQDVIPGFYCADLLLELDGLFPATVVTNYPIIQNIVSRPTFLNDETIQEVA